MRQIILIAHNLRSAHNVGSLLRTAEGLGVDKVFLSGYTPYPKMTDDIRLPHITRSSHHKISKTALGAETMIPNQHIDDIDALIKVLKSQGYAICALEQNPISVDLPDYQPTDKTVLIVGREVEGIEAEILDQADHILQIPMFGRKESFNVVQAAAMALYHLRFT
ncbi:MAG: TrmH family RNA methyltransferase [Candidatus Saccharimonadales bacterium]